MARWSQVNGVWTCKNPSTTDRTEPISHGIPLDGKAPGIVIKHGQWKLDNKRKFDKPTERDIKKLEDEDDARRAKTMDIEPVVMEAKKDLESGKIRVDGECLREADKRITPFGHVTDERGVTHVLPRYKLPPVEQDKQFNTNVLGNIKDVRPENVSEKDGKRGEGPGEQKYTLEEVKEMMRQKMQIEKASVTLGRPVGGNAGISTAAQLRKMMNHAINGDRDQMRGQTFGY